MLTSGDLVYLELGIPEGREAGFLHPAVLITSQGILLEMPTVVHVVPLTSTLRGFFTEVEIKPDSLNGLESVSAAQCQHLRAVSPSRITEVRGNVGPMTLNQIREVIATMLDLS